MKRLIHISAAMALILFLGCSPHQEPEDVPPPPKAPEQEQKPESAKQIIENYGEGLVTSMDKARAAQAKVDIREVQRVIQDYALAHDGAYPASLDEISGSLAGIDLSSFDYDPSNGSVSLR